MALVWSKVLALLLLLQLARPISGLRFTVGDRVECYVEDDTWQPGTVARVQVEHEGGIAPFAVQLDRGDAVIAPADQERFIRPLGGLRFRVGDRVECHVEDDQWAAGTVDRLTVAHEGGTAPYAVNLDRGGAVIAPVDDDRYIRAFGARPTTANDISARLLRFAVGARVECNMGMYWERGSVVRLNYHDPRDLKAPPVPYEVQLDSGDLVSAPRDDDEVIRREGSIVMRDAGLRFGVGERVEVARALDDGSHGWAAGRVVALRYHEPRFGEGVTMPYQVKLDADARLIFVTEDTAAAVRRGPPPTAATPRPARRQVVSSGSKLSKRSKVGRQASTIGMRSAGKVGGKFGAGPPAARHPMKPEAQRERQSNFVAWNAAGRPVEPMGAAADPLAQWKEITERV